MAKVTSKLQVTLPKRIADTHGIRPGDDIEFQSIGDVIRIVPTKDSSRGELSIEERLRLFDEATDRLRHRASPDSPGPERVKSRGWTREELYRRGSDD